MNAFADRLALSTSTARRLAVLALVAALAAVALLVSGFVSVSGHSTASPRWNKTTSVAGSAVFAKPASPRWN